MFKRLKNIIRPIYRKFFHQSKSVQTDMPPAACPFTGKQPRNEFTDYDVIKNIFSDDRHFLTSPCYDTLDPHHMLLSAGGKAHDEVTRRIREYISNHKTELEEDISLIASELFFTICLPTKYLIFVLFIVISWQLVLWQLFWECRLVN